MIERFEISDCCPECGETLLKGGYCRRCDEWHVDVDERA